MSKHHSYFHIVYDGPALESNEMDIKDLAPALLAVSEALDEANQIFNKGRAMVGINVKCSFKTGCFGIDLSINQDIIKNLLSCFKDESIINGATLLAYLGFANPAAVKTGKGLLHVIKWLRNRDIKKIDMGDNGIATLYIDDDILAVDREILELLRSHKIRKAIEKAVCEPLSHDGIDSFCCGSDLLYSDADKIFTVNKYETGFFVAPDPMDEVIHESIHETSLQAVSIVFQEKNKWSFTDGANTFFAEIADTVFVKRVHDNDVSFSKDDILTVRMRTKQTLTAKGIKTEYTIMNVLNHRSASRQLPLPM